MDGLATHILEYIQERRDEKLKKEKDAAKQLEITAKHEPETWLSDAARRAKHLTLATHSPKYVHPDANGTSINSMSSDKVGDGYISTQSVSEIPYDVVGTAAAQAVGNFLLLEHEGQILIDTLRRGENAPLLAIAPDADTAQEWADGFLSVLASPEPSAHKFSKQCYWPVKRRLNTISSFLSTPPHWRTRSTLLFNTHDSPTKPKQPVNSRRKEEYSEQEDIRYLDIAVQGFGGTKPQNISQLNSQRGGKAYLVSCEPPDWQRQTTPPLNIKSIFSSAL